MPSVRPPEECELDEDRLLRSAKQESLDPRAKEIYKQLAEVCYQEDNFQNQRLLKWLVLQEQARGPLAIKLAAEYQEGPDGTILIMYWIKAKDIPHYDVPFQKVSLLRFQV